MQWRGRRQSTNVEDQRGRRAGGNMMGGLGGGLLTKGGIGVVIVILIIGWLTGRNPLTLLQEIGGSSTGVGYEQTTDESYVPSAEEEELAAFTRVVLADTEDVWNSLLQGSVNRPWFCFQGTYNRLVDLPVRLRVRFIAVPMSNSTLI